jgi:hypothetical protein
MKQEKIKDLEEKVRLLEEGNKLLSHENMVLRYYTLIVKKGGRAPMLSSKEKQILQDWEWRARHKQLTEEELAAMHEARTGNVSQ